MKKTTILLTLLCSFAVTSCGSGNMTTQPQYQPKNTGSKAVMSEDAWRLYRMNDQVVIQSKISLIFGEGRKIRGFAGCNKYFGSLQKFANGQVSIKSIARTKKLCGGSNNVNQIESDYIRALEASSNYQLNDTQLIISSATNQLVFLKKRRR